MAKKIKLNEVNAEMTFEQCMEKWYRHCRVNNYAEKTIVYYQNTIHVFKKFFDESRLANTIDEVKQMTADNTVDMYMTFGNISEDFLKLIDINGSYKIGTREATTFIEEEYNMGHIGRFNIIS